MQAPTVADRYLRQRSSGFLVSLSLLLVSAVGAVDYLTGYDISLGVFYLIPVALATWYVGRRAGLILSLASGLTWLLANAYTSRGVGLPLQLVAWNATTRLLFFVVVCLLLSALAASYEQQKTMARTDHLTGLANARVFHELAEREVLRSHRRRLPLSLVYLDLDRFKEVNDRYGHGEGDRLLELLGPALRDGLRATDLVGRLGGDEFAILLPDTDSVAAREVAEKIRELIRREMTANRWPVTASLGVVTCLAPEMRAADLILTADRLMYAAKETERGSIRSAVLGGDGRPEGGGDEPMVRSTLRSE